MIEIVATAVVVATGISLVLFAACTMFAKNKAARFISAFASSLGAHITEQIARLIAGGGFVVCASQMRFSAFFVVLGWLLIVTSTGLLLTPWRWHHRFGEWVIPLVLKHITLYGLGALALGVFILVSII